MARLVLALTTVLALAVVAASVPVTGPVDVSPDGDSAEGGDEQREEQGGDLPVEGWVAVLAVLALVVGGGAVAAWRALRGSEPSDAEETPDAAADPDPDLAAVAAAAGRAAERLENRDPDAFENEVYHAWQTMTIALGADDDATRTPAEFARLAVTAGMDPDDVDELTRLFAAVRYGDVAVTPEREQRASDLLWRIDRTYGER